VTEIVWANPHVQIFLDVKNEKGKVRELGHESQSPGILHRNGWNRTSLSSRATRSRLLLRPPRMGAPVGFSEGNTGKVVFSDGHVLKYDER